MWFRVLVLCCRAPYHIETFFIMNLYCYRIRIHIEHPICNESCSYWFPIDIGALLILRPYWLSDTVITKSLFILRCYWHCFLIHFWMLWILRPYLFWDLFMSPYLHYGIIDSETLLIVSPNWYWGPMYIVSLFTVVTYSHWKPFNIETLMILFHALRSGSKLTSSIAIKLRNSSRGLEIW